MRNAEELVYGGIVSPGSRTKWASTSLSSEFDYVLERLCKMQRDTIRMSRVDGGENVIEIDDDVM